MKKKNMICIFAFCLILLAEFSFANDSAETLLIMQETCLHKDYNSFQVITKIPANTEVLVRATNNNWYNVSYNKGDENITGWIMMETTTVGGVGDATVTALGTGLTTDQRNYLRNYVTVFVNEGRSKNIFLYKDDDLTMLYNGYNMKLSNGTKNGGKFENKLIYVCSTITATLLHNALGVPLNGETSNGIAYTPTPIRGTGFCNPNGGGKEIFFDVGNNYLEIGDVLAYDNYHTHVGLYLGYNEQTGYHEVAQTQGSSVNITNLAGTKGLPRITLAQLGATKWREAVRVKQEVLPRDWVRPRQINWPI